MADYMGFIPAVGWRAAVTMKDGRYLDTPLVAWAFGQHDLGVAFIPDPDGGGTAVELCKASAAGLGIEEFRVYHPGAKKTRTRRAAPPGSPLVHLLLTDIDDPERESGTFARCCGINWRALAASGTVTSRRDLVTCPGQPKAAAGSWPGEEHRREPHFHVHVADEGEHAHVHRHGTEEHSHLHEHVPGTP
jgi:hypothetical protein